ncbi:MAG TPA: alpha/beta hydrolase [Acidimicrobiales bacterium]|nr:alpha/beta hydrolase [Acidimicrobiales bacterium]
MEERTLVDVHGIELFTRWWPVDTPQGIVLISHGASEHTGRYDRFARALNAAGLAVAALDHRGHGRTVPAPGPATIGPGGGQALVDGVHALRQAATERFGTSSETPQFLFGHSLGSMIALAYLVQHSAGLAGGVLCGFPVDPIETEAMVNLLRDVVSAGMRDEPMADLAPNVGPDGGPPRTRFDWLSRDADEVDRYVDDPLCGDGNPLTYGYVLDLAEVVAEAAGRLGSIECPVLVIAGDQDPAGANGDHPRKLVGALREAGRRVDATIYEGARHELLNETNRDEVTADVIEWFMRRR